MISLSFSWSSLHSFQDVQIVLMRSETILEYFLGWKKYFSESWVSCSWVEPFAPDSNLKIWCFVNFEKSWKRVKLPIFDTILRKMYIWNFQFLGSVKYLDKYLSESWVSCSWVEPFARDSNLKIWCFVNFEKSSKRVKSPMFDTILRKICIINLEIFLDQ